MYWYECTYRVLVLLSCTRTYDGVGVLVDVLQNLLEAPQAANAGLETTLSALIVRAFQPNKNRMWRSFYAIRMLRGSLTHLAEMYIRM